MVQFMRIKKRKLESNKRMWLYEKSILVFWAIVCLLPIQGGLRISNETYKKYIAVDYDYFAFVMQAEVYQNMLWNFNGAYYLSSRYTTTNDDMDSF